jgi:hypothetical protein
MKISFVLPLIIFALTSCEEPAEGLKASNVKRMGFEPKYIISYKEVNQRFINSEIHKNAAGDLGNNKVATAPELEAYYEADVELSIDDDLNYHLEIEYTSGSPSELLPEDFFEDNIYPHDTELAIFKKTETNGVATYFNKSGAVIEVFDNSNSENFLAWKEEALLAKVTMLRAVLYTNTNTLADGQNNRIKRLEKKGATTKVLSSERLKVVTRHANHTSKEILSLKTGYILSRYSYNEEGIQARTFFKYKKVNGLALIDNEIQHSFTNLENGKRDIFYETHIARTNIQVKEFGDKK